MTEYDNNTDPLLDALHHELASLMVEQEALRKLMSEATAEADVEQLAVLLPALSSLRLAIRDAEDNIGVYERRKAAERKEAERLAALARLPEPELLGPICNRYGTLFLIEADGRKYLALECEVRPQCVEVSPTFYEAFKAEFGDKDYDDSGRSIQIRMNEYREYGYDIPVMEAQ